MTVEGLTVVTEAPVSKQDQPLWVAGASRLQAVEHQGAAKSGPVSNSVVVPAGRSVCSASHVSEMSCCSLDSQCSRHTDGRTLTGKRSCKTDNSACRTR